MVSILPIKLVLAKAGSGRAPAYAWACPRESGGMEYGCVHQLLNPENVTPSLDLTSHPDLGQRLTDIGNQAIDLSCYEQLLTSEGSVGND